MRNKKTGAETPKYRHPMPPPRPLPDIDELSRETDSVPIYRKAVTHIPTRERLIAILRVPIFPHELADPAEAVADYLLDNDVVPVVRCKDCVSCEAEKAGPFGFLLCRSIGGEVFADDFCSKGRWRDPR